MPAKTRFKGWRVWIKEDCEEHPYECEILRIVKEGGNDYYEVRCEKDIFYVACVGVQKIYPKSRILESELTNVIVLSDRIKSKRTG